MRDVQLFKSWIALLVTVGLLGVLFSLLSVAPKGEAKDALLIVLGALIAITKDVFGYYFGSSEGSQRKTELLSGVKNEI